MRVRNWSGAAILLLALTLALPARALVPKTVLQFGHVSKVDAAVWTPEGDYVISADAFDSSVIIWDTADGTILDHLRIPPLDPKGMFDARSVVAMRHVDGGEQGKVAITVDGIGPVGDDPRAGMRFNFILDLATREVLPSGQPQPVSAAKVNAEQIDAKLAPLPASADGKSQLLRVGNDLKIVTGASETPLKGRPHGYYWDADLSPGGSLVARLLHVGQAAAAMTRATVWDARDGAAWRPFDVVGTTYTKLRWLGNQYYVLSAGGPFGNLAATATTPSLVVHAWTSKLVGQVPAQCMATPVGYAGLFVGAGPSSCGAPSSASDGLWLYKPRVPGKGFSLDRVWQQVNVPELRGQIITAIASQYSVEDKSWAIVATTRPEQPVDGVYPISVLAVVTDPVIKTIFKQAASAKDLAGYGAQNTIVQKVAFASDGKSLLLHLGGGVIVLPMATGKGGVTIQGNTNNPELVASDGKTIIIGGRFIKTLLRYEATKGTQLLPPIAVAGVINGGFIPGRPIFWAASSDSALRFWDSRTGAKLVSYFSFPGDKYFATTPDGRYDTNLGADTEAVRWLMPDDRFMSLPLETYMRDFYEPQLLQRTLDCTAKSTCATAFKPLRDMAGLNRVLPEVTIDSVRPGPDPGTVIVDVSAQEGIDKDAPNGLTHSGVHDLRLYRYGQLVAQDPVSSSSISANDIVAWRKATRVKGTERGKGVQISFTVQMPTKDPMARKGQTAFSAYAFNSDRVKGLTGKLVAVTGPAPVPRPFAPRAYVIAIGVNSYNIPGKSLQYAVSDAQAVTKALAAVPGRETVRVMLTADASGNKAQKRQIEAVFGVLAGENVDANRALLKKAGIDTSQLDMATPDDAVIIAFSGHGYVSAQGDFYILPSDAVQPDPANPKTLASAISSAELTDWLRGVDAGDMALVIDACHSAASVASPGFKPGPLGDPGLGQLAWDKGIRILAATQSDDVALEDDALGQGLLTYVLVREGLGGKAYADNDGKISLGAWLRFGSSRLPAFGRERAIARTNASGDDAPLMVARVATPPAEHVQRPSLFDFTPYVSPVLLPIAPHP